MWDVSLDMLVVVVGGALAQNLWIYACIMNGDKSGMTPTEL
jgi:hypothetical protein